MSMPVQMPTSRLPTPQIDASLWTSVLCIIRSHVLQRRRMTQYFSGRPYSPAGSSQSMARPPSGLALTPALLWLIEHQRCLYPFSPLPCIGNSSIISVLFGAPTSASPPHVSPDAKSPGNMHAWAFPRNEADQDTEDLYSSTGLSSGLIASICGSDTSATSSIVQTSVAVLASIFSIRVAGEGLDTWIQPRDVHVRSEHAVQPGIAQRGSLKCRDFVFVCLPTQGKPVITGTRVFLGFHYFSRWKPAGPMEPAIAGRKLSILTRRSAARSYPEQHRAQLLIPNTRRHNVPVQCPEIQQCSQTGNHLPFSRDRLGRSFVPGVPGKGVIIDIVG
ncbi:hypothetical protein DFJ58DRAFT_864368 [Suillus subalutaceus]|uniref:uncharacterized protein n=1 Tax=Suillus subalutaceus TaxID=48586 RepID=UPI001B877E47|nr:uncharacterized protein DFJ58DRAFT_864368 [Suillus subalutaceus]KAG1836730.1 hypothetical protein DFJ58DRAFT_864368 [Suillus subalutaceus]